MRLQTTPKREARKAVTTRVDETELLEALRAGVHIAVTSHHNPDGDALGSMLACAALLRAMGAKSATPVHCDPVPSRYAWLPDSDTIVPPDDPAMDRADTLVVVDVAQHDRIGRVAERVSKGMRVIVIDHHLENEPWGDLQLIDSAAAATGEIILRLFDAAGCTPTAGDALNLYVAIATDTGGFRFPNTTTATHEAAARLLAYGVDVGAVTTRVFDCIPMPKFRLMVQFLDNTRFEANGRLAISEVSHQQLEELGATPEDLEGLINYPRNVEGVQVAILLRSAASGETKLSVRSTAEFNASEFCKQFGGGGHAAAAGANLATSLTQARQLVADRARARLGALS